MFTNIRRVGSIFSSTVLCCYFRSLQFLDNVGFLIKVRWIIWFARSIQMPGFSWSAFIPRHTSRGFIISVGILFFGVLSRLREPAAIFRLPTPLLLRRSWRNPDVFSHKLLGSNYYRISCLQVGWLVRCPRKVTHYRSFLLQRYDQFSCWFHRCLSQIVLRNL